MSASEEARKGGCCGVAERKKGAEECCPTAAAPTRGNEGGCCGIKLTACCAPATGEAGGESIREQVKKSYSSVASAAGSSDESAKKGHQVIAEKFGYSREDLQCIPCGSNLGLGCGNPVAFASLKEGETVVDFGCGSGVDCFLAAKKVGPSGRVIGVDMTEQMIKNANENLTTTGLTNVQFVLGTIEDIKEDNIADVIISNCVINLVPDKRDAFRSAYRVLKHGGRLSISDIALKAKLPECVAKSVAAYTGCIAGALLVSETEAILKEVGFTDVKVIDSNADLNVYMQAGGTFGCAFPGLEGLEPSLAAIDANKFAASVKIFATKP